MPLSKNIAAYPAVMFDIARKIRFLEEPLPVPCADRKKAIRLRQQFYGFAAALEHWAEQHPDSPLRYEYKALADAIRSVTIKLEEETLYLVSRFTDPDLSPLNKLLGDLGRLEQTSPLPSLEEMAKREEEQVLESDRVMERMGLSPHAPDFDPTTPSGPRPKPAPVEDRTETERELTPYERFQLRTNNDGDSD